MATISNLSLTIEGFDDTRVTATVRYRLTPSVIEKLAGTVFSDSIQLVGDDPGVSSDIVITTFPPDAFAVSNSTPTVDRTRTRRVYKSAMNEDPQYETTGGEVIDETFARITLTYAAGAPIPPTLPSPEITNIVRGVWK